MPQTSVIIVSLAHLLVRYVYLQAVIMAIEKSKSRIIDMMVSLLRTLSTTNIVTPDEFAKVTTVNGVCGKLCKFTPMTSPCSLICLFLFSRIFYCDVQKCRRVRCHDCSELHTNVQCSPLCRCRHLHIEK